MLLLSPPVAKKTNQTLHASCGGLTYPIRLHLQLTALGFELLREGEAIFDELRDQWGRQIGPAELENLETHLTELVGTPPVRFDTPGWISRDLGEPI